MGIGMRYSTQTLTADHPELLDIVSRMIKRGDPIVFPTDTVYGVGVSPFLAEGIETIYALKFRSHDKGIPVLVSDIDHLPQLLPPDFFGSGGNQPASRLKLIKSWIDRFWPGPLTLILPKRPTLPPNLSPNDGIAVRMPDHRLARQIIPACGGALATTSANLSGQPPAQTGAEALAALGGSVAGIVSQDGGNIGQASTIVSLIDTHPIVVRHGPISPSELDLE